MENESSDIILVVSENNFVVNKNVLAANSRYFRAMFFGGFSESHAKTVTLFGITDVKAFDALLDYITKKKINLVGLSDIVSSALELADMFGEEAFEQDLREELITNWRKFDTLKEILDFGKSLNFRSEILCRILLCLKKEYTRQAGQPVISSPKIVTEILTDLNLFYTKSSRRQIDFARSIISWWIKCQLEQTDLRTILEVLVTDVPKCELFAVVLQMKANVRHSLEQELNLVLRNNREKILNYVEEVCVGNVQWDLHVLALHHQEWIWDDIYETTSFRSITEAELEAEAQNLVCISIGPRYGLYLTSPYKRELGFKTCLPNIRQYQGTFINLPYRINTLQHRDLFRIQDTQTRPDVIDLWVTRLAIQNGALSFKKICHAVCDTEDILGCQLCRVGDILHVFVSCKEADKGSVVRYFDMKLGDKVGRKVIRIPNISERPPLLVTERRLIPVAAVTSKHEPIVLFQSDEEHLWLTRYNSQLSTLEPLGYLPPLGIPYEHVEFIYMGAKD